MTEKWYRGRQGRDLMRRRRKTTNPATRLTIPPGSNWYDQGYSLADEIFEPVALYTRHRTVQET